MKFEGGREEICMVKMGEKGKQQMKKENSNNFFKKKQVTKNLKTFN